MSRWLIALPGALAVTALLAFALGWVIGLDRAADTNEYITAGAVTAAGGSRTRPQRAEIPVRHVYPVPVWDPGPAVPDPHPGLAPEIVATAAPGLPAVIVLRTACTVHLRHRSDGTVELDARDCPDPARLAAVRTLVESGLRPHAGSGHEARPRLVEITAHFVGPPDREP